MAGATGRCTCGLLAVTAVTDKDKPGVPEPRQIGSYDLAKTDDDDEALVITVHYFDGQPCKRYDREARTRLHLSGEKIAGKPYPE